MKSCLTIITETAARVRSECSDNSEMLAFYDWKERNALESWAESCGRGEFDDCSTEKLSRLHDEAVDCDDYSFAGRIRAELSGRDDYVDGSADGDCDDLSKCDDWDNAPF